MKTQNFLLNIKTINDVKNYLKILRDENYRKILINLYGGKLYGTN